MIKYDEKFETSISELLEVDSVLMTDYLNSFDSWDSLTKLSIIAFCMEEYGVSLTAEEIDKSETIKGLKELIESRMKERLLL